MLPTSANLSRGSELAPFVPSDDQPEVSLLAVWEFVRRRRTLIISCTIVAAVAFGAWAATRPTKFTAHATFIPEGKRNTSQLSGLAAQFGLTGFQSDGSQSPQFYADLVTSPTVLRDLVLAPYSLDGTGTPRKGILVSELDARGSTPPQRVDDAMKRLAKNLNATVSAKTGLVSVDASAPTAALAQQIAQNVIDDVNKVNLQLRQTQAEADRQFAEDRVTELGNELRDAENRLENFMQSNRDYRASPRLSLEQERLSREVAMREQVFSTMAAAYEQDRIESARDNPVLSVVDVPTAPVRPDPRGLGKALLGGAILGLILGVMVGLVGEVVAAVRRAGADRRPLSSDA